MEGLKRRMDTGARDRDRTDTPPFGKAADFKNNLPAVKLVLVRVLPGQFSLCNILCNARQIGLEGFVWFAFIATSGYLSFLEIAN